MANRVGVPVATLVVVVASVVLLAVPTVPRTPTTAQAPSGPTVSAAALTPSIYYNYTDFFNVPYGEWWDLRTKQYAVDYPIGADCFNATSVALGICTTSVTGLKKVISYPYENWAGPASTAAIYAPYRLHVAAQNIGGYNLSQPVFLPVFNYGAAPGNLLTFSWNLQYLDVAAGNALTAAGCPGVSPSKPYFDGYKIRSMIYLTMDPQESARIFGSPATTNPTTLNNWWASEVNTACSTSGTLETAFNNWISGEGNGKYDIYNGYAGVYSALYTNMSYKIDLDGTTHVFIDHAAWGTETLLDRWFYWGNASYATYYADSTKRAGWWGMENGWWEDFHYIGTFGATTMNFALSGVLQYHLQERSMPGPDGVYRSSTNTADSDDVPVWTWGPELLDYPTGLAAGSKHPSEVFSRYSGLNYIKTTPGSADYGTNTSFDYVPISWVAGAGEWWNFVFPTNSSAYYQNPATATLGTTLPGTQLPSITSTLSFQKIFPSMYGTWNAATGTWYVAGGTAESWPTGAPSSYPYYSYPGIFFAPAPGPPVASTMPASGITTTAAMLNGNLASLGSATTVTVGFLWGTSSSLTSATNVTVGSKTATGTFGTALSALAAATTYYFEAWANGNGFAHGAILSFRTAGTPPSVVTDPATGITTTAATLNGHTTSLGTAASITVGFLWGTSSTLTGAANVTAGTQTATAAFSSSLTGLASGTTYYFEAWANGHGFATGSILSFTTGTSATAPAVTTTAASGITTTGATLNGNLAGLGTASSVTVGFLWGTSSTLAGATNVTVGAKTATGAFSTALTGLTPGTTYYYQAWANGNGFAFGVILSFTTLSTPPSVVTDAASGITTTGASLNGHTTNLGTAASVTVGFLWSTSSALAGATNVTASSQTAAGSFTTALTTLLYGTTYYFEAWANGQGFATGSILSFTTVTPTSPPSVATSAASGITASAATLYGATMSLGTAATVSVGFLWGTSSALAGATNVTAGSQTAAGPFSSPLTGLTPGTTYYFEAWANGDGFATGSVMSFATTTVTASPPSVSTVAASAITTTTASLNGRLAGLGTASPVTVGFLWGTSATLSGAANVTVGAETGTGAFASALSGLTPGTTYYFEAWALGAGFVKGTILSFTTESPALSPPATILGLPALVAYAVLAAVVAIVVIAPLAVFLMRRRRRSPPTNP